MRCCRSTKNKPHIKCKKSNEPGGNLCDPCSKIVPVIDHNNCHLWSDNSKTCNACEICTDEVFHCVICNSEFCDDCVTEWSMRAFIFNNNTFFCCKKCFPDKFLCDNDNDPLYHKKTIMGPADRMLGYCFACDQYHDTYLKNDDSFCPLLENEIPPMIKKIWALKKQENSFIQPTNNQNSSSAPPPVEVDFLQFYMDTNENVINPNRKGDSINIYRSIEKLLNSKNSLQNSIFNLSDVSENLKSSNNIDVGNSPNIITSPDITKPGKITFNTETERNAASDTINSTAFNLNLSSEIHKLTACFKNLESQVKSIAENQSCIKIPYYRNSNNILVRDQFTFTKDQIAFKSDPEPKTYDQNYVDKLIAENKKKLDDSFRNGFNAGQNSAIQNSIAQLPLLNQHRFQQNNNSSTPAIAYFNNDDNSFQSPIFDNNNFSNNNYRSFRPANRGRGNRRNNFQRR